MSSPFLYYPFETIIIILKVSDGSSLGSRYKAKGGIGTAAITLEWFLVANNKSGHDVASAKQIYLSKDCSAANSALDHLEFSAAAVRSLARDAAAQIEEEVTLDIVQYQKKKQQTGGEEAATKLASKDKYVKEPHEVGEDKFTA